MFIDRWDLAMVLTSFLKGKHWGEFGEKERRWHLCEVGDSYGVCKKCLYCQRLENDWVRINELLNSPMVQI